MNLDIEQLEMNHPMLALAPIRYLEAARLALLRAKHSAPVYASVRLNDVASTATLIWDAKAQKPLFDVIDSHRLTEDAAEAVALSFVHAHAKWRVHRRCRRGEHADWLLRSPTGERYAALEISGIADDSISTMQARLDEKTAQVEKSLVASEKLAVVVGFAGISIFARSR